MHATLVLRDVVLRGRNLELAIAARAFETYAKPQAFFGEIAIRKAARMEAQQAFALAEGRLFERQQRAFDERVFGGIERCAVPRWTCWLRLRVWRGLRVRLGLRVADDDKRGNVFRRRGK